MLRRQKQLARVLLITLLFLCSQHPAAKATSMISFDFEFKSYGQLVGLGEITIKIDPSALPFNRWESFSDYNVSQASFTRTPIGYQFPFNITESEIINRVTSKDVNIGMKYFISDGQAQYPLDILFDNPTHSIRFYTYTLNADPKDIFTINDNGTWLYKPNGRPMDEWGQGTWAAAVKFDTPPSQPVPEPATMLLLGTGFTGLIGARRKKKP